MPLSPRILWESHGNKYMRSRDNELIHAWRDCSNITGATTFLLLLIAADLAFILLHILHDLHVLGSPLHSLGRDHGYPEIYQYIKEFWIVVLLLSILARTRVIGHGVWALLFLYLLFDDARKIHETFGKYVATRLEYTSYFGIPGRDLGELAISAMAAAAFLTALIWPYMRGAHGFKRVTRHLLALLVALAFFGVFLDTLHSVFRQWEHSWDFWIVAEDGGEMVVMSLIAWYVYMLNATNGNLEFTLRNRHLDFASR